MSDVIRVEGLTKSYGRFKALKGLDLGVERGEVHGFLGPTALVNRPLFVCCWGCFGRTVALSRS